jgi:hypothetical protein
MMLAAQHAYSLMAFQVRRGGIIRLATLAAPQTEFDHAGALWVWGWLPSNYVE